MEHRAISLFLSLSCLLQSVTGSIIINGNRVQDGAMQYMASVQNMFGHICGGFLVTDNFVLTAAHCSEKKPVRVVLGNHHLQNPQNGQTILIDKKFKHPSYKDVGTGDDLMLLKLRRRAVVGNGVQIIQLPHTNVEELQNCQVAGWGATETGGRSVTDLMATRVSIIDNTICRNAWGYLPHNVICAGGYNTNRGFCQGDSGGPLVCGNTAVGIVSYNRHHKCNYVDEVPNVFVDISKYFNWILDTITNASHESL